MAEIRFPGRCPWAKRRVGGVLRCTPPRATVIRVKGVNESPAACRTLMSDNSPLEGFLDDDGGNWGPDWKVLKIHGRTTVVRPAEVPPALLERICGQDTERAQRLGRELGQPAPAPFSLGAGPVGAVGTFTNGRGGCPVSTSFRDNFTFLAPGDGTLTITQPSTGDRVTGAIKADGTFQLRSAGESYDGKITGNNVTATYSYTARGCTETYEVTFVLQR